LEQIATKLTSFKARLDGSSVTNRKGSYAPPRVTATPRITIAESQKFEWIPVQGDPTARSRARAHISRGLRRKKVFDEQQSKEANKDNAGSTSSSSPGSRSEKQSSAISAEGFPPNRSHDAIDIRSAQTVIENMMLKRTLGIGGGSRADDPFRFFPVKLSHSDQAILDHCELTQLTWELQSRELNCACKDLFVYAPDSLTAESRASFQGIKNFSFDSALQHPSAFHVVLALGASQ
jgi:hypothetical protein